jgi:hypothetical protein
MRYVRLSTERAFALHGAWGRRAFLVWLHGGIVRINNPISPRTTTKNFCSDPSLPSPVWRACSVVGHLHSVAGRMPLQVGKERKKPGTTLRPPSFYPKAASGDFQASIRLINYGRGRSHMAYFSCLTFAHSIACVS